MNLYIQHSDHIPLPTAATFIRGSSCFTWLKEISRWDLPVADLTCYVMPASALSIEAGGLFVIFKHPEKIRQNNLLEPYGCIRQKLFIPVNAELLPQVREDELQQLLLWEHQVFQPSVGFIGFEQKDQINISDLLHFDKPLATDWSFAHPGALLRPPFRQIEVIRPTVEELIDSMKDDIGQKPLADIPRDTENERNAIEKIGDSLKFGLLKGVLVVANILHKLLPRTNNPNPVNLGSFLQKIQNWLERNLDELEKKTK